MPTSPQAAQAAETPKDRVARAMDAVRRGDLGPVAELAPAAAQLAGDVAPLTRDENTSVRREAVVLLSLAGGRTALPALIAALEDASADVRERAARGLYDRYAPAELADRSDLPKALAVALSKEAPPVAAVLLAAYAPTDEAQEALKNLLESSAKAKLRDAAAPVSLSLAARVALARHGEPEAIAAVERAAGKATGAEAEFLLDALREIDAASALRAVAKGTLSDRREAATLLHSAPELRPRIADLAVAAFVQRLGLKVGFPVSDLRRYDDEEIAQVERLVEEAVPDRPVPQQ